MYGLLALASQDKVRYGKANDIRRKGKSLRCICDTLFTLDFTTMEKEANYQRKQCWAVANWAHEAVPIKGARDTGIISQTIA